MGGKKPILDGVIDFLDFLQRKDSSPEERRKIFILYGAKSKENIQRIVDLCKDGMYVLEKDKETQFITKKDGEKLATTQNIIQETLSITIKGIEFLESHKKADIKKDQQNTQIFLTLGLFTAAFFQGIVLLSYYYLELKNSVDLLTANTFIVLLTILLVGMFYILYKCAKFFKPL